MRTTGKQCGLAATGGYQPSLRSPWLAAEDLRLANVTPHVAQNTTNRSSAIDERTTRHGGYATSLKIRKRIEECFGWLMSDFINYATLGSKINNLRVDCCIINATNVQ